MMIISTLFMTALVGAILSFIAQSITGRGSKNHIRRHATIAPIALFCTFFGAVFAYHYLEIQLCRAEIRAYIYGQQSPLVEPIFHPHFLFHSFCGNAMMEQMYALYGEAAASGFDDPDPRVRARALQASLSVSGYGWNGIPEGVFQKVVHHAGRDPDPIVQQVLKPYQQYLTEYDSKQKQ